MIEKLDRFVDTREKRSCLLYTITYLCWGVFACIHILCALSLLKLHNYDELFQLTQNEMLRSSYLVRMVMEMMSLPFFALNKVIHIIVTQIQVLEVMLLLTTFLCFHIRHYAKLYKQRIQCFVLLFGIGCLFIAILGIQGVQADSLGQAINMVRMIGAVFLLISVIILLITLVSLYRLFTHEYREAMKVEVIIET